MSTAIQSYPFVGSSWLKSDEIKKTYPFSWSSVYVDTMVWDDKRHGLWCMDNNGVLVLMKISKQEDVMEQVRTVPQLAVFPPGILPICIGYVGHIGCGAVRVVDRISAFATAIVPDDEAKQRSFDMPSFSICVEPASGNLYIAGGDSFILEYEPDTRHFKKWALAPSDAIPIGEIKWTRIVSNGQPGHYWIAADDGDSYQWSGDEIECKILEDCFLEEKRIAVAVRNGLFFHLTDMGRVYSIDLDTRMMTNETELAWNSWNRVYPTLVGSSDLNVQCIYMLTATDITAITPRRIRLHGKNQVQWVCTGLPIPWTSSDSCYPFPVHGLCNGIETMFFPTRNRSSIDYLALPVPSSGV